MVINIKHFIITIIAIFLSLGIGIFVGVIIDSQQLFIEQQKVLVSEIEDEFDGFKQKNYELMSKLEEYKEENDRNDKFLDLVYYKLINESLVGSNIMVINLFSENDILDVKEALSNAGTNEIIEVNIYNQSEEKVADMFKTMNNKSVNDVIMRDEIKKINFEKIYSKISNKEYNMLPFYLKSIEGFDYKGNMYTDIDYVILVDNGFNIDNKYYKNARNKLIELINKNYIPIMVVEKSTEKTSSIPFYIELGISTVDNVDTKLGKIAMLGVLKGAKGHFGEKKTAEKLIPDECFNIGIR